MDPSGNFIAMPSVTGGQYILMQTQGSGPQYTLVDSNSMYRIQKPLVDMTGDVFNQQHTQMVQTAQPFTLLSYDNSGQTSGAVAVTSTASTGPSGALAPTLTHINTIYGDTQQLGIVKLESDGSQIIPIQYSTTGTSGGTVTSATGNNIMMAAMAAADENLVTDQNFAIFPNALMTSEGSVNLVASSAAGTVATTEGTGTTGSNSNANFMSLLEAVARVTEVKTE